MRRRKIHNKRGDKRYFSKSANRVHKKNLPSPMGLRGGIRL